MNNFMCEACIHSLNCAKVTIIILSDTMAVPNQSGYLVDDKGVICTAIYRPFNGYYYADDIYGVVAKYEKN